MFQLTRLCVLYGLSGDDNRFRLYELEVMGRITAPADPTGLVATPWDGAVALDWDDNAEADLVGYNIYRSTVSGSGYSIVTQGVSASGFFDWCRYA